MSTLSHSPSDERLASTVQRFFRQHQIGRLLRSCNFRKESGFSCRDVLLFIFTLVFGRKNLFRTLQTDREEAALCGKDPVYRLLNNPSHNWRRLLLALSAAMINGLARLTKATREDVFIVDDSLYERGRSKAVELLARVHDHNRNRFVRGFRLLTLGWSDGNTFVPLAFSLLSSAKASNRFQEADERIDKRTVGYRRRQESVRKSTEVLLDLLREALKNGIKARHLLFDSWFAFNGTIRKVVEEGVHVVCMTKALPSITYRYQGKTYTLKRLYGQLKKRPGRAKILASVIVSLGEDSTGKPVRARIVFVRDRHHKRQWLALLSTDLDLPDDEIIRIYGKRWDIEVFFKMAKSYLCLAKEFQGRSYDMMIAHTTIVCIRYLMLSLEARNHEDPRTVGNLFYACCDEMQDITFATAFLRLLDLLKQAIQRVVTLTEEQFEAIFEHFLAGLPPFLRHSLGIQPCES